MIRTLAIGLVVLGGLDAPAGGEVVITFDKVETGKPMPSYTDQGVVFALARRPTMNRAAGVFDVSHMCVVDLRGAEFDLLLALVERPYHVMTRDQLLDVARARPVVAMDRSVDVHVSRLRQRIEADPKDPKLIRTVRSGGYVFAAPVAVNGGRP